MYPDQQLPPPQPQQPPQPQGGGYGYTPQQPQYPQSPVTNQPTSDPAAGTNPFITPPPVDNFGEATPDGVRQQYEYPVDYLNSIAAQPQAKPIGIKATIFAVVGGLAIMGLVGALLFGGNSTPPVKERLVALNARYLTIADVAKKNHKYLKDGDLRAANVALQAFLYTSSTNLKEPAVKLGIKDISKSIPSNVKKAETAHTLEMNQKFEDAALNGTIDRIYSREMSYELDLLGPQMKSIYEDTRNKDIRAALEKTGNDLSTIQDIFAKYNPE